MSTHNQGSRKFWFVGPRPVFEALDRFSLQKDITKSVHNNSCKIKIKMSQIITTLYFLSMEQFFLIICHHPNFSVDSVPVPEIRKKLSQIITKLPFPFSGVLFSFS